VLICCPLSLGELLNTTNAWAPDKISRDQNFWDNIRALIFVPYNSNVTMLRSTNLSCRRGKNKDEYQAGHQFRWR
jgi:hypothetical protein